MFETENCLVTVSNEFVLISSIHILTSAVWLYECTSTWLIRISSTSIRRRSLALVASCRESI